MDVALAIHNLLPSAKYGGSTTENTKECFDALRWEDERPKPTWTQVQASWDSIKDNLSQYMPGN